MTDRSRPTDRLASAAGALLASLALAACADPGPDDRIRAGNDAMGNGNHAAALAQFEAALEQLDPKDERYLSARLRSIEARIHLDPERAKEEFLDLARTETSRVTDRDYQTVGGMLANARAHLQAVDVMDAGLQAHPESPGLQALKDRIVEDAERADDSALTEKLRGLGYVD